MDFQEKEKYTFADLIEIMKLLRSPQGCPWDREQNHTTIRQNFIEETYEVVEAIDRQDTELLKEELGDVLLQVVFHAQMEEETGNFTIDDVSDGICKKLIVRHPHVFGDVVADNTNAVLNNWDKIKMKTKSQTNQSDAMISVSKALPSLMRAAKIQQKAAKVGFDWENIDGPLSKISEELDELREALNSSNQEHIEEEFGDLLFSVVNVSRFIHSDAEKALYKACDKFTDRFIRMENLAKVKDINIQSATLSELDSLWNEVKIIS
ncbi:MAG: nucleoside triphosphate pyrophosphohydrolase [Bacillota bacterium]|nr:nucleoside triphosphate pyrophosphohydrolase [Bacillota bacterium]